MKYYHYLIIGFILYLFYRRWKNTITVQAPEPIQIGTEPTPAPPAAANLKLQKILFTEYLMNNVSGQDDLPALGRIHELENYINNDPKAATWKYDITARATLNGISYNERLRLEAIYSIRGY